MSKWIPKVGAELTNREKEYIRQIALGLEDSEIATRLGMATGTGRIYRVHIRKKLGARNSAHAVALAFKKEIIRWKPNAKKG